MDANEMRRKAEEALHLFVGQNASFKEGQYEAIEATLTNKRTLVVQRTAVLVGERVWCTSSAQRF